MKFAFIHAEKARFPVTLLCNVLGVSTAGYYAWRDRPMSKRQQGDAALSDVITTIHANSRRTYGSPRVHAELKALEVSISKKRVARLMRQNGLAARRRRRFRPSTTDSNHRYPVADNALAREFARSGPNQAWVGDITYVPTSEGWLYLAVLLDLYSRRVVGWAMSETIDRQLVLGALKMAVANRGVPAGGVLHHSDRGSQYASSDYRRALADYGFKSSMSRKGNCWDNAVSESFFATLKVELIHRHRYATRAAARRSIFEYIEVFYNRQRRHSTLNYVSPSQFEAISIKSPVYA